MTIRLKISIGFILVASIFVFAAAQANFFHTASTISVIIIPHHDLVATQRKDFLYALKNKIQPKTIILISPNHYDVGNAAMQTVDQDWNISGGVIKSRSEVVQALIKSGIGNEASSFFDEHGIHLVLSDIHHAFPNANLVPVIIKSSATKQDVIKLESVLRKSCSDCLLIDSVDFSHYQPALLADLHDALTIRALENRDEDALFQNAEVDSPGALMLAARWAKDNATNHFVVWKHTNSGELLKQPDMESTTHVFGYYESGKPAAPEQRVSFVIGGDMMFGRMIGHVFLNRNTPAGLAGLPQVFEKMGNRVFWGVDAKIANLEGPISKTPVPDDYNSKNLLFDFPPQAIDALKFLKLNAVSMANNHSANADMQGVLDTRDLLASADIQPIGGPGNQDIPQVGIFHGEKLNLIIIGVHALYAPADISDLIKKYKQDPNNRVMIFPHWGVEYAQTHNTNQEQLAHAWVDAGADIVIGSHPHVIQDSEVYKHKPIIYSLGNFVFDQNFSKETQQGLLIAGEFTDRGLSLFGLPIQSIHYQPIMMRGGAKQQILDRLYASLAQYIQHTPRGDKLFFSL